MSIPKVEKIDPARTGFFDSLFIDYIAKKESLKDFYAYHPSPEVFREVLEKKSFSQEARNLLTEVLKNQYKEVEISELVKTNIESFNSSKTFTVTTGHQLNLFTGPLFFTYKILTTINLAEQLKKLYPEYHFVPVYWMATEDHDLEEINHFNLFGKKYIWETEQQGATGRMSTEGIDQLLDSLPEKFEATEKAYREKRSLSEATRLLVNELFGKYGLVILDPDNAVLKKEFQEVIRKELLESIAGNAALESSEKLDNQGYKTQVFPREINLFFINESERSRIVKDGDDFVVLPDRRYPQNEFLNLVETAPEKFSPNVVLRPVYQEIILPNLAYCGGPAEVAYWLQLKEVFKRFQVSFPVILPRNFILYVNKATEEKWSKLGFSNKDLLLNDTELKKMYIQRVSETDEDTAEEEKCIDAAFDILLQKASSADKSLEGFILAEKQKMKKQVENIHKRIKKAEEKRHETVLGQIEKIKAKLFPGGGLQERVETLFTFFANDPLFLEHIKQVADPFDFNFKIVTEE